MYWLAPPPTRRYVAAALLVLAAVTWDLVPEPTTEYPYAGSELVAGTPVDEADIRWRRVASRVLPVTVPHGVLRVDVAEGEPLLPSHLTDVPVPEGWWVVEVEVPPGAVVGGPVRVAVTATGALEATLVEGVVVRGSAGRLGGSPGAVAVPESASALVAAAARSNQLVVLAGG